MANAYILNHNVLRIMGLSDDPSDRVIQCTAVFAGVIVIAIDHFDVIKEMGIEEEEFFTKLTRDGVGLGIFTIVTTTRVKFYSSGNPE
mgnify:CR=1 FL=1